ncbi:hypothetical protein QC762_123357 [Podospora pseudocomata]|uniref:Uncharacterized protein n=1 Tax=Podospora pseudocomata TaxID=2093779 RepID=A0ABR0GYR1_9PEZI|nr:hypothetical protein QC762_123357 [Podospora pseudocomata]
MEVELPLMKYARNIKNDKTFMPKGGYLGFYTSHSYSHTSETFSVSAIKGIDRAIWQGFLSLGYHVDLRPVLITERYEDDSYRYVMGKYFPAETYQNWQVDDETHLKRLIKSWGISRVKFKEVVWMNESHDEHKQRQLMYMVYGNEAPIHSDYSYCTVIVHVPEWDNQLGARAKLTSDPDNESECVSSLDFADTDREEAMAMDESEEEEEDESGSEYGGQIHACFLQPEIEGMSLENLWAYEVVKARLVN